jgi:hypothetical protein
MGVSTADLTGGWILESANFEIEDSGEIVELFGPNPTGAILFTEQGRMMAILTGNNRRRRAMTTARLSYSTL